MHSQRNKDFYMTNPLGVHGSSIKKVHANYPQYFKQDTDKTKFCSEKVTSFFIPRA